MVINILCCADVPFCILINKKLFGLHFVSSLPCDVEYFGVAKFVSQSTVRHYVLNNGTTIVNEVDVRKRVWTGFVCFGMLGEGGAGLQ